MIVKVDGTIPAERLAKLIARLNLLIKFWFQKYNQKIKLLIIFLKSKFYFIKVTLFNYRKIFISNVKLQQYCFLYYHL